MAVLCRLSYSSGDEAMIEARSMTRPALALLAALVLAACQGSAPAVEDLPTGTLHIDTGGGEVRVEVSIAETSETRVRGLMEVEELGDDAGMVFLQPEPTDYPFWMKDTLIPLSIAFWDRGGQIRAILDMEPCPAWSCPLYYPGVSWLGAVEVNQGFFEERGVEIGDRVRLER
jgi:uncharacterized membrane protein (UPF0127 family)